MEDVKASIDLPDMPPRDAMQVTRYLEQVAKSMERIPRYMIPTPEGKPYLERLILERKEDRSGVYLHIIYESDGDRDPHDHPFDFTSEIVWGSYREHSYTRSCEECLRDYHDDVKVCESCGAPVSCAELDAPKVFMACAVNEKKAHQLHRLTILKGPVITLVHRGPKVREWGFQTPQGWEHHKDYIARKFPGAQPTEVGD